METLTNLHRIVSSRLTRLMKRDFRSGCSPSVTGLSFPEGSPPRCPPPHLLSVGMQPVDWWSAVSLIRSDSEAWASHQLCVCVVPAIWPVGAWIGLASHLQPNGFLPMPPTLSSYSPKQTVQWPHPTMATQLNSIHG